jgi:hypothetical protein
MFKIVCRGGFGRKRGKGSGEGGEKGSGGKLRRVSLKESEREKEGDRWMGERVEGMEYVIM